MYLDGERSLSIRIYKDKDYLDFIVVRNPNIEYKHKENGHVVLKIWHTGFFDRLAQKFFSTPKYSNVEMDKYGSFVWDNIDGQRSVAEIAELISNKYGEQAAPYEARLLTFCKILQSRDLVGFMKKQAQ